MISVHVFARRDAEIYSSFSLRLGISARDMSRGWWLLTANCHPLQEEFSCGKFSRLLKRRTTI
jgi:hypothetical protein